MNYYPKGYLKDIEFKQLKSLIKDYANVGYNSWPEEVKLKVNEYGRLLQKRYWTEQSSNALLVKIGGPLQTILTGTIGLLILLWRKYSIFINGMKPLDWLTTFLSLFWLREAFKMKETAVFIFTLILTLTIQGHTLIDKYTEIQAEKVKIDHNKSQKSVTMVNEEFLEHLPDGGGELIGFYDLTGSVRKIEVTLYISHGVQEYSFYLKDETPFFIEDNFINFAWDEETSTFDYDRFDGGFHGTYIFLDGHLIDNTGLGHNRFEDDQIDIEDTLKAECENYLQKIKKRLASKP